MSQPGGAAAPQVTRDRGRGGGRGSPAACRARAPAGGSGAGPGGRGAGAAPLGRCGARAARGRRPGLTGIQHRAPPAAPCSDRSPETKRREHGAAIAVWTIQILRKCNLLPALPLPRNLQFPPDPLCSQGPWRLPASTTGELFFQAPIFATIFFLKGHISFFQFFFLIFLQTVVFFPIKTTPPRGYYFVNNKKRN